MLDSLFSPRERHEWQLAQQTMVTEGKGAPESAAVIPSFPGYDIVGELGRGGMGVVYRAQQVNLNRVVALKVMRSGEHATAQELSRFRTEAQAVARLRHPNIVHIYDVGEHNGIPYLSLEFAGRSNLEQLTKRTTFSAEQAAQIVATLARAIHYAHEQGIVHRDLKPSNVLFDSSQDVATPKITDFGLAKMLNASSSMPTQTVVGTPSYMAPEQAAGKDEPVTPLADVYSLGAILYEALTGKAPFRGANAWEILEKVRRQEPLPPRRLRRDVPRNLEIICLKCLEKDPALRYSSALALAEDLQSFLAHQRIEARPPSLRRRLFKTLRRRPAMVGLAALSMLFGLMLGVVDYRHAQQLHALEAQVRADERQVLHERLQRDRIRAVAGTDPAKHAPPPSTLVSP